MITLVFLEAVKNGSTSIRQNPVRQACFRQNYFRQNTVWTKSRFDKVHFRQCSFSPKFIFDKNGFDKNPIRQGSFSTKSRFDKNGFDKRRIRQGSFSTKSFTTTYIFDKIIYDKARKNDAKKWNLEAFAIQRVCGSMPSPSPSLPLTQMLSQSRLHAKQESEISGPRTRPG